MLEHCNINQSNFRSILSISISFIQKFYFDTINYTYTYSNNLVGFSPKRLTGLPGQNQYYVVILYAGIIIFVFLLVHR